MNIVVDTSILIAVIIGEKEKNKIIEITSGHTLIGPNSIEWEIGNAFSAMLKRNRITLETACKGIKLFQKIPINYVNSDFFNVLTLAKKYNMYAYDMYFIDCCIKYTVPLLTLDKKLSNIALKENINILEL